jgi:acyl-CoA oxidase
MSLSTAAFLVTIELLGTKEQVALWQDCIYNGTVIGSYGQTELGHGSNVQNL